MASKLTENDLPAQIKSLVRNRRKDPITIPLKPRLVSRHVPQERLTDFTERHRELLVLDFTLSLKTDGIAELDKNAEAAEEKVAQDEIRLVKEEAALDTYVKEHDTQCVKSIKEAEIASDKRRHAQILLKSTQENLTALQVELAKSRTLQDEFQSHTAFLKSIDGEEFTSPIQLVNVLERIEEDVDDLKETCREGAKIIASLEGKILEEKRSWDAEVVEAKSGIQEAQAETAKNDRHCAQISARLAAEKELAQERQAEELIKNIRDVHEVVVTGKGGDGHQMLEQIHALAKGLLDTLGGLKKDDLASVKRQLAIEARAEKSASFTPRGRKTVRMAG